MIKFDLDEVVNQHVVAPAIVGLNDAARYALERARYHAPVRRLFKGQRLRTGLGGHRELRLTAAEVFGSPRRVTARGIGALEFRSAADIQAFHQERARRYQVAGISNRVLTSGAGRITGNANTFVPVCARGKARLVGEFRRYNPVMRRLENVPAMLTQPGREPTYLSGGNVTSRLNARGRYEVRSGRAVFTSTEESPSGPVSVTTLGGRLRGELRMVPAEAAATSLVWAYVESPTYYARFQEFGTSHNRAHPFLRPALYESRQPLRQLVVRAIGRGR